MLTNASVDIPAKPRVLIADDSKIVRATLIKHIQGMFEFREALNGEEAWETLLVDPSIRVVITDLTMPKLDGYGLLKRIRSSEINRIRNLPVVVVSGSDEQAERDKAKAAGATDLITKGIGTAQLLSRLDILAKLANTQHEFERSLEVLAKNASAQPVLQLSTPAALDMYAEKTLGLAMKARKNFVMLYVMVGLKHAGVEGEASSPPPTVVHAIGQLLQRTVRQTDKVAQTGEAEFAVVTGTIHFDAARNFAQRICRAIANANMVKDDRMTFIASCGVAAASEHYPNGEVGQVTQITAGDLKEIARRRAQLGLRLTTTGVVGAEEEDAFGSNGSLPKGISLSPEANGAAPAGSAVSFFQKQDEEGEGPIELATLVRWIKEGKQDKVVQHMREMSHELKPLVELLLQQGQR
ncbi:MAG: response regulator [Burkholderiales bacterium]|nr:response regulator [Burkholderiales bacterium]